MSKLKITLILSAIILVLAGLRLAAYVADNRTANPEEMLERYTDSSGTPYYRINAGINNAYLIPTNGGWFLIDTGYPDDYDRFKNALALAGIEIASIRWLFITHAHDEHAGFAAALKKESGCRLIVPEQALDDLRAGRMVWNGRAINRRIAFASTLYNFVKRRELRYPPIAIGPDDVVLKDDENDIAKIIGLEGKFLATPGHSPDSWSLLMSDGRAFCGDAAMNYLNLLGADYRPIFITDEKQTYESLQKILKAGAGMFCSGHGPTFDKSKIEGIFDRLEIIQERKGV